MDFTDDACMNMFTTGQRDRIRSLFQEGGPRFALLSSKGCTGTPLPEPAELPADSLTGASIRVYPNPAFSNVTISIQNDDSQIGKTITVHNYLGQLVMQQQITKGVIQLSVYNLKDGLYFIHIGDRKNVYRLLKVGKSLNP